MRRTCVRTRAWVSESPGEPDPVCHAAMTQHLLTPQCSTWNTAAAFPPRTRHPWHASTVRFHVEHQTEASPAPRGSEEGRKEGPRPRVPHAGWPDACSRTPRPTAPRFTCTSVLPRSVHTGLGTIRAQPSRAFESDATAVDDLPHRDSPMLADTTRSTWNRGPSRRPLTSGVDGTPATPTASSSSPRWLRPPAGDTPTMFHVKPCDSLRRRSRPMVD